MIYSLKCKFCGEIYNALSPSQKCSKCGELNNTYKKVCKDCGYNWTSNIPSVEICPKCGGNRRKEFKMIKQRVCNLTCKICGYKYQAGSSKAKCPKCLEKLLESNSVKEFKRLKDDKNCEIHFINENSGILLLPIKDGKMKAEKECLICKRKFKLNYPSQKICGSCYRFSKCKNCDKFYLTDSTNGFCSIRCSNLYRHKSQIFFNNDKNKTKINPNNIKVRNQKEIYFPKNFKIEEKDFLNFKEVAGIWYKVDKKNNIVLDVCLTTDIYEEIKYHQKQIKNPTKQKYIEMSRISEDIEFYFLKEIKDWETGLDEELNFALETDAKYWSPSPFYQTKKYSKALAEKIEKENKEKASI